MLHTIVKTYECFKLRYYSFIIYFIPVVHAVQTYDNTAIITTKKSMNKRKRITMIPWDHSCLKKYWTWVNVQIIKKKLAL
jgi:hypothetical protein